MRMGEIRALTWEGVDLFRKMVTVFRSKNGERRKAKVRSLKSDYVFPSDTFILLDDSDLRCAFRGAMKVCGIENFHFHDLSNCLDNYASCTTFGCQGVPVCTIALSIVSSFRIAATKATFGALPAVRKRW